MGREPSALDGLFSFALLRRGFGQLFDEAFRADDEGRDAIRYVGALVIHRQLGEGGEGLLDTAPFLHDGRVFPLLRFNAVLDRGDLLFQVRDPLFVRSSRVLTFRHVQFVLFLENGGPLLLDHPDTKLGLKFLSLTSALLHR